MLEPDAAADKRERWLVLAVLVGTFVLFTPALDFGFVYDDLRVVLGNRTLRSWSGVYRGFTAHFWAFDPNKQGPGGYYRPLVVATLTLAYQLFGERSTGYHALSILLHCAAGLLVYTLGTALRLPRFARVFGLALFLLHPLQIQAVAWISAISDLLIAITVLSAQLAWIRFLRRGRPLDALLALLAFLAALLTLERALPAIASLLLLSALREPLGLLPDGVAAVRGRCDRLRELSVHAALFAAPCLVVLAARQLALGDSPAWPGHAILDSFQAGPAAALHYVRSTMWPEELSVAYPVHARPAPSLTRWLADAAIVGCVLGLGVASSWRRPQRVWLGGSALALIAPCLLVGLLPDFALVQDRYAYLPLAYVALWIGDVLAAQLPLAASRGPQLASAAAVAGWCVLAMSWHRPNLAPWRDNLALYTRAIEVDPDSPYFAMNLANERRRRGLRDPDCALLSRVAAQLRHDPRAGDPALAHYNLGNCLRERGQHRDALREYARAQSYARGGMLPAGINRVITLFEVGDAATAEREARELVRVHPRAGEAWQVLGVTLARSGQLEEGRRALQRAVELDPNDRASAAMLAASAPTTP